MTRIQKGIYATVIVILIGVISICLCGHSAAKEKDDRREVRIYQTVSVEAGDTLWGIANEYYDAEHYRDVKTYLYEICKVNRIGDERVYAGGEIVVPVYVEEH